jgi:hypothetical protein
LFGRDASSGHAPLAARLLEHLHHVGGLAGLADADRQRAPEVGGSAVQRGQGRRGEPRAREIFDGMYWYFVDHPSAIDGDLMAWSQNHSCENNEGATSATDGDLDIAFALLLADKQWGSTGDINYRAEAVRVMNAIMASEVDGSGSYLLLGDWADPDEKIYYDATRSSDFMPGHLTAFDDLRPDDGWGTLRDRSYDMFQTVQEDHAASTGLLPDFIRNPADSPTPGASSGSTTCGPRSCRPRSTTPTSTTPSSCCR